MNLLTRAQHAAIDILIVFVLAVAPQALILDLEGTAATLAYILAGVHLLMTLLTADLPGLPGVPGSLLPLPLHGLIEAVVGVALGLIGWLAFDGTTQTFYLVMAALILLVFAITPYLDSSS